MKHNVSYSEDHPPVRSSVLQTILGRAHITPEECGKGGRGGYYEKYASNVVRQH